MKLVGYVRVSTMRQVDEGLSLSVQEAALREYAQQHDHQLVLVTRDEGLSGKSAERPGLQEALGALRTGKAEGLLVVRLDRLTRSLIDLGQLLEEYFVKGGAQLISIHEAWDTTTASGRMVIYILGVVAQWEREKIVERVRETVEHKRRQGEYLGGHRPLGYHVQGKKLVANRREQAAVERARALKLEGHSLRRIAEELAADGFLNRRGKPFGPSSVRRMVEDSNQGGNR